jgi:thiamine-monophosphate kinase
MNEFQLIQQYFSAQTLSRRDVIKGIGDDSAIVTLPSDHQLVVTTDTLISGVHFPISTRPEDIGYKALAVNLSDLAAMGATPAWVTLALTLPEINSDWLERFCEGFFHLANAFNVQLIGGDTTKGALSITIQALGILPVHQGLLRSSAKPLDLIYVTGTLGDAALALGYLQHQVIVKETYQAFLLQRLNRPEPRITCGKSIRHISHAAIDISDGLAADLNHVLEASQVGAILYVDQLPLSVEMRDTLPLLDAQHLALTGGDDYELCFTIPLAKQVELEKILADISCPYTCIGQITTQFGLEVCYQNGSKYHGSIQGYQHF